MAKTEQALESVKKEKTEAERKVEILQQAKKRHSKRTDKEIQHIQERWNRRNVMRAGVIQTNYDFEKIKLVKSVKDVQKIMDNFLKKIPRRNAIFFNKNKNVQRKAYNKRLYSNEN